MTFLEILSVIIVLLSIIAIKVVFHFDINTYQRDKRETDERKLKNICPHCAVSNIENNRVHVNYLYSSPVGTHKWLCSQCGLILNSRNDFERLVEPYNKNPMLILEKQERFYKKTKKLGLV